MLLVAQSAISVLRFVFSLGVLHGILCLFAYISVEILMNNSDMLMSKEQ